MMRGRYSRRVSPLDPAAIRAYVGRDWQKARSAKRAYWRERLARGGMAEALRVTEQLHRVPTDAERDEDLQTHQRVAEALAKTATVSSRARARRVRDRRSR